MEDEHGGNNRNQGKEEEGLDLENGDLNQDYAGEEGKEDPYGGDDNLQDSTSPQRKRKGVEEQGKGHKVRVCLDEEEVSS